MTASGLLRSALALVLSTAPCLAGAQALPTRVRIEPPACAEGPFDARAWVTLARNELETDGVEVTVEGPASPDDVARVRVAVTPCRADATEAELTIDDLATRKTVRRVVALDDVAPEGRARALALAVAELLRASWAELAAPDAPPAADAIRRAVLLRLRPPPRAQTPASAPPATAALPEHALRLDLTLDARLFPAQGGALLGPRVRGWWTPSRRAPVVVGLELGGGFGGANARRGEVSLASLSGAAGVYVTARAERVELAVGPRVEFGHAWLAGAPFDPRDAGASGDGPIALAWLAAAARVRASQRAWVTLDAAVGHTLAYVTASADGERVVGLRGVALSLGVGAGLGW